jgi:hypothetical protein
MFPKSVAPMETDAQSRAKFDIFFRVPSKAALPPGPPHGVPSERHAPFLEPCKRVSPSTGAPLGNLEGIRLPGLLASKG